MEALPKPPVLGNSMIVPSVQELASKSLVKVPPQYIQMLDHQDPPFIINEVLTVTSALPIIDLQTLLSHPETNNNNFDSELVKLHSACKKWGFFQLVNHGVNTSLLDKVKSEIESFFKLPMEEKKKYWQDEENFEGFGQAFVFSEEQKLDWADMFYMITLPRQARKHHLFPKLPGALRDALESYTSELQNIAMKLVEFIGRALEIETKVMNEFFKDGLQTMRMNYYPPCPQPELVMGLASHSDAIGISILFQLNEIEGLQIKNEGIWIPVKPLPNTFVVNLGDILEILTNGLYRSVEHRVTVNSMKERLSVATFYSPKLEEVIGPLPCLINPHNPALFKTVGVEEYFKKRYSLKLNGKLTIDFMRIEGDTA